jgi:hypothetical protein
MGRQAPTLPGANVSADLGRALDDAEALIVLISPAAMKSRMVRHDIQFALGQESFRDHSRLSWTLSQFQWIDFTRGFDRGRKADLRETFDSFLIASSGAQAE